MSKIKVGDIVEVKSGAKYHGKLQNKVTSISDCGSFLRVNGNRVEARVDHFKLADTSKWHKHRDLIIAWANGAEIQSQASNETKWSSVNSPNWFTRYNYRIKPSEPSELEKLEAKYIELGNAIKELKEAQS